MRYQLYPDASGEWRWRLVAANNLVLADSGEGYKTKAGARAGVTRNKRANARTPVEVLDADPRAPASADPRSPSPQGAVRG